MLTGGVFIKISEENPWLWAILSNSPDGIAVSDPEFKVLYANEQFARMVGVPLEKVLGSTGDQLSPGWSRQMGHIYEEVRRTGKPIKSESNRFYFENQPERGITYWNSTVAPVNGKDGEFLGWVLMLREVTERKRIEAEKAKLLQEKEAQSELLAKIIDNSPSGIALLDGNTFTVKWNNQPYQAFLDEPFHDIDLTGRSLEEFIPQALEHGFLNVLREVAATGLQRIVNEYQYSGFKRGETYWKCRVIPIPTQSTVTDLMIVIDEISEQVLNRKRLEEYTRQAESHLQQLEAVFESLEEGVIIFDLNGRRLKSNSTALSVLGYGACPGLEDNIIGGQDYQLQDLNGKVIPLEEWPLNRIIGGLAVRDFEVECRRISTGDSRYVSYNGTLVNNSEGAPMFVVVTCRDISDREQLIRRLELEQARLTAVLDQMPSGVVIAEAPSGKLMSFNKRHAEILMQADIPVQLSERFKTFKYFHRDGRQFFQQEWPLFRSITYGETVSNVESIVQRRDGSFAVLLINSAPIIDRQGNIVAGVVVTSDITDLKNAMTKAALANQLQQIIEFLPDAILVVDRERKVIAWNRANEIATGILKQDAIGKDTSFLVEKTSKGKPLLIDIILGEDVDSDLPIEKNGDTFSTRLDSQTPEGRDIHLDIQATYLKNENGEIIGAIEVVHDITRQREIEVETVRIQKLESVGILAGGIAHDFNNYLAAIMSNVQLAGLRLNHGGEIASLLKTVEDVVMQASSLTKQLLAFSKGGTPVKKITAIHHMIQETAQFALRGTKVTYTCQIASDLWKVNVDIGQIAQVLTNLLINASQAMPDGGAITIQGENLILESKETLPLKPSEYIKVSVTDQGIGIPKENLPKIFDPYFTTKKQGNGLGLSVCFSIIKNHDGYIGVESTVGTGSTFYFLLPAISGCHDSITAFSEDEFSGKIEQGKILIMDDEMNIILPVSQILQKIGYEVELATDGSEAITKFIKSQNEGKPYDVVVLDLTVRGGLGGKQTMERLIKINPEVKAVVCSGYSNDPVLANYREFHFREMVTKPYKVEDLRRILFQLLNDNIA